MFRRSENGTDELINETEGATIVPTGSASPSQPSAPNVAAAASAPQASMPSMASSPQPQAASPAFRPVPPQAAMVAASRSAMPQAQAPQQQAHAEPARPASVAATPLSRPASKRVLTVGPEIQMKGEITSCDRVVIEGVVDATMRDVHTVELAETGALKGTAEVEDAEISGSFEGDLVVRGKLTVYASGRVRGNVTYGEIEIQRGGQISGNIRNAADAKAGAAGNPQKRAA
jgi:cytoskeletal protein CcmA (bactofilin family)